MPKNCPQKNSLLLAPGIIHIILIIIVLIISGVVLAAALIPFRKQQNALAQVGQKAPDFTLVDFQGNQSRLSDFQGKEIILDFWGTWCALCMDGMQVLENVQQDLGDQVVILGVHRSDFESQKRASLIAKGLGISYTLLTGTREVYNLYKFTEDVPITYFIDKNGIIAARISGAKTEDQIKNQISQLSTP